MKTPGTTPSDIDGWLESGLRKGLDPVVESARHLTPGRYAGATASRALRWPGKAALGGLAVAGVLAVTAVAAAAATTGSADPTVWGQQVTAAVESCKDNLGSAHGGIGQCVSAFATRHGELNSAAHRSGAASHSANGSAEGVPGQGNPDHGTGPSNSDRGNSSSHGSLNPGTDNNGQDSGKPTTTPGHGSSGGSAPSDLAHSPGPRN